MVFSACEGARAVQKPTLVDISRDNLGTAPVDRSTGPRLHRRTSRYGCDYERDRDDSHVDSGESLSGHAKTHQRYHDSGSEATWEGDPEERRGNDGAGEQRVRGSYSFLSRFEEGDGRTPRNSSPRPTRAVTRWRCRTISPRRATSPSASTRQRTSTLDPESLTINTIELVVEASVPDIDEATFMEFAEGGKENCPVSRVLAGAEITLDATLQ